MGLFGKSSPKGKGAVLPPKGEKESKPKGTQQEQAIKNIKSRNQALQDVLKNMP